MAGLPSHIFVVRHGNRLDTADNQWHLTSPTPYDSPLTYGGFLQARQVGNQISNVLEQAKLESEIRNGESRRKRFKVIIHTSPFLRCLQTSVGISSGLAQTSPDSIYDPSDIIVPPCSPVLASQSLKSAILRIDPFLGEWLNPEYFEFITPPPGPALMLGAAKAQLQRKESYSKYVDASECEPYKPTNQNNSLWQASPTSSPATGSQTPDNDQLLAMSTLRSALFGDAHRKKKGYVPPRPTYAVSSGGMIPDGFVAHARDVAVVVDEKWDSMRPPMDFGDGGKLGEEWIAMHKRFRRGLRNLVNWYATNEYAAELTSSMTPHVEHETLSSNSDEGVETVIIIVSHAAGCNALIGAITHQPVLIDISIASLTMAVTKPSINYQHLLDAERAADPDGSVSMVPVDHMYELRMSASTEHLRSSSASTPVSARPSAMANVLYPTNRGRTSTFSGIGPAVKDSLLSGHPFTSAGSRSNSANASMSAMTRRDSSNRNTRTPPTAAAGMSSRAVSMDRDSPSPAMSSSGLWSPPSTGLPAVDEGLDGRYRSGDYFNELISDYDRHHFDLSTLEQTIPPNLEAALENERHSSPTPMSTPPTFSGPMTINTDLAPPCKPAEQVAVTQLGGGLGGLWGKPPSPDEAEKRRDRSRAKRRWTVDQRA